MSATVLPHLSRKITNEAARLDIRISIERQHTHRKRNHPSNGWFTLYGSIIRISSMCRLCNRAPIDLGPFRPPVRSTPKGDGRGCGDTAE